MNDYRRDTAPKTVRDTLAQLNSIGYKLPADVADAVARLDHLEGLKPVEATPQTLRQAYVDGDADRAELEAHAARVAAANLAMQAWSAARSDVALALDQVIRSHVDDVIEHLRPAAEKAIAELVWYAEQGAPEVASLLRDGRTKDATRAAVIEGSLVELQRLRTIRRDVSPNGFPWARLSYANPERVPDLKATGVAHVVAAVQAGADLWWPTWEQAVNMVDRLEQGDAEQVGAARQQKQLQRQMAL